MKNVKYITEKSRPNLFREVSGTMKATITLLLVLFTSICSFAQNIDWINAPLNPVPQGMDLKYQHLKGDVMQESILDYFTRDGKWLSYRGNEMLKKDAQGRIIEYRDEKGNAYPYQYDSKGNLISSSGSTYEYDNKNRLIKANHKYETSQYSYKNQGDLLIITEKSTFDGKTNESEHHYKNGLRILQKSSGGGLKYEYTFDDKGNWISKESIDAATNKALFNQYTGKPLKPTIRNIIYYSDYDKGLSAITVQLKDLTEGRVANAPLIPHPFFNGKELEKQMIARLIDDYVFYEPLAKTYYIARNAFLKTNKVGQKIPVEILISGEENILLYNGKYIGVVEKGSKGEDENDWKTINYTETLSSFVSVHQKTGSAYAFENIPKISNGKTVAIVGKSIPDIWYATINNKNGIYVFKNGLALNLKSISGYLANSKTQDLIVAVEGGTEYILPDYENSVDKKFYKARLFNPATDKIQTQKSSSSNTTPATGSNANSQYVADANSFSEAFKKGKSEGQQQLYSLMKAQRNLNKNDAQIATYFYQLYHYLYPKDVKMSFELVYLLPLTELTAAAPITKIVKSLMTKEEYQTFANQAYDRLYNDK